MNIEPRTMAHHPDALPVRFRRDVANHSLRGIVQAKQPKAYYLEGLTAIFQPGVSLPGELRVDQHFSGAEVALLYPGANLVELLGIANRFPEVRCLHIIESCEANLDVIRRELENERKLRALPEMAGYVTDIGHPPENLIGQCDLVIEVNVINPKADKMFRQEAARHISRMLKLGGIFYSAGKTIRWTDRVFPLNLVCVRIPAKALKHVGYSDALPTPVFYLKHLPDMPVTTGEATVAKGWWITFRSWFERKPTSTDKVAVETTFVPRVENGCGEPNAAPWDFLITKPAVRRPAMAWQPKPGDRFGNLTLGSLLQFNRQTGMYVFLINELPEVVVKLMQPFEGDIPDDPLEWDNLRKSKTLKRENQALTLLKGLGFIPQRIAHGYDPVTGWYAIVVEQEKSHPLERLIAQQYNRRQRHHETAAEAARMVEPILKLLDSLAVVHDHGLVHQDLKPAHIFLRANPSEAALIDWGLARKIDEPLSESIRSGSWIHAPPERLDPEMQARAAIHQDLYAVGVILLQMASDMDLEEQPRLLFDFFLKNSRTPSSAEFEPMLRPHWKWAAPVIARAVSSQKAVPGYAIERFPSAREMAREILSRRNQTTPATE